MPTPIDVQGGTASADPFSGQTYDYGSGWLADPAIQQLLTTMTGGRWNTNWQNPDLQSAFQNNGQQITLGDIMGQLQGGIADFSNQVQAVTGAPPTADQINQYAQQVLIPQSTQTGPTGYNPFNPTNMQQMAQNYVPTAFAPQIQQNQTNQQTQALNNNINTGTNMINQSEQGFISNLTNPTSSLYQGFSGAMNNLGISPSSGAFQAGLGSTIGQNQNQLESQLMSGLGFPALAGIQGLSGQANANLQGAQPTAQAGLTNQANSMQNFAMQSQLAQLLANQGQPSGAMKDLGMASGAANAAVGLGTGIGALSSATWICTAMWRAKVLAASEVDRLHQHLFRVFFKRFWKFMGYFLLGRFVVFGAEWIHIDWEKWRPAFYDRVIAEPDPVKAIALYEAAFWMLVKKVWLAARIKSMIVYHKPMEG